MRRCAVRRTSRAEFIREIFSIAQHRRRSLAMTPAAQKRENKESNMLNKLLAAAAVAAFAYATCPANAAKMGAGCSGGNLTKTESMVEAMPDGDAKFSAQKEISAAQDSMLAGKMGACASHLGKAMHAGGTK
jgi:hypothetical protein